MNGLLLSLLAAALTAAEPETRKTPAPLPAKPPAEDYRVVVDEEPPGPEGREEPAARHPVRRHGLGRLASVDAKERRVVLEHEDGVEQSLSVPESARLTFASDERPLRLDQLRRGDAVAYSVEGNRLARLHLDLCGDGSGSPDDDFFSPPPRRRGARRPPPPPPDEEPEFRSVDEPDVPMYQSEPAEAPPRKR